MYSDEDIVFARNEYREARSNGSWTPSIYLYGEEVAYYYGQRLDHFAETFLVRRFFDVVTGFHHGSLDLAGRHNDRYDKHMETWESFLIDFNNVTEAMSLGKIMETSNPFALIEAPFEEFCGIWKLPLETITHADLCDYTKRVLQVVQEQAEPKMQKLCFSDLPVEILDRVFELCGVDEGRLLSATSHEFHTIGARHIFKERVLRFETPPGYYEGINHHSDSANFTITAAENARKRLVASVDFVARRPSIARRVLKLELSDCWSGTPLYFDNPRLSGFYVPLQGAWLLAMKICTNVQVLELKSITLDPRFVDGICGLHQLHTLIVECPASPTTADKILNHPTKTVPSVRTLRMSMKRRASGTDLWSLLLLFPQLQYFSVQQVLSDHWRSQQPTSGFLSAPPQSLWDRIDLSSLEHLSISNFHPLTLEVVSRWLKHAPRMMNLKQLRFYSCYGVKDAAMIGFLQSFSGAPLRLLVINGIAEGGHRLFRFLSECFSTLRGIMLLRRASPRQLMTRESSWPLRPFEYARYLSSLPDLQYFGWNRQGNQYWHLGSLPLLRFEQDFPAGVIDPLDDLWEDHDDDWTARTFAQMCPNLKAYTHECGSLRLIDRSDDGRIGVRRQGECGRWMRTLPGFSDSNFGYMYWEPVLPDIIM